MKAQLSQSKYHIAVVGLGYVGLSNAMLLAKHNKVIGVDTSQKRVDALTKRQSPIDDPELSEYLSNTDLQFTAVTELNNAVIDADYILVATPTNYDPKTGYFDTSSLEEVVKKSVELAPNAYVIIKSTVPVGFVERIRHQLSTESIVFSPEFLREGRALHDNLYPSRIIIGDKSKSAKIFAKLILNATLKQNVAVYYTGSREAEAIKLFSNTYLAMRVAYFNELDSYALLTGLNAKEIIEGVSMDPRIGQHYNNPSFGYGGYCLPKDTKQLLANFRNVPQNIMQAIVDANTTRQDFLVKKIVERNPKIVGVYRLAMKKNSDNFRESASIAILKKIKAEGIMVVIYEPSIDEPTYLNCEVYKNINDFKEISDVIVTNRSDQDLNNVQEKVFTRDIFNEN